MQSVAIKYHTTLAEYFSAQPLYLDEAEKKKPNARKLVELPWQQVYAGAWSELESTLSSIRFVYEKCVAGMTYGLVGDYRLALQAWPSDTGLNPDKGNPLLPRMVAPRNVRLFSQFLMAHAHIFIRDPHQVIAFAHNYASSGPVVEAADMEIAEGWYISPWIQLLDRPKLIQHSALIYTLTPHSSPVTWVAMSSDLEIAVSSDEIGIIRVWNMLQQQMITEIKSPDGTGIVNLSLARDKKSMIVVTADGACFHWQSIQNTTSQMLPATPVATCVALTPDGNFAAIGGADGSINLWSVKQKMRLAKLGSHRGAVSAVAISDDATIIASGGVDEEVRIWDTGRHQEKARVPGHLFGIRSVAMDSTGMMVLTCEGQIPGDYKNRDNFRGITNRAVVQIVSATGEQLMSEEAHNIEIQRSEGGIFGGLQGSTIYNVASTPDGSLGVSVGYDGRICIWDLQERKLVRRFSTYRGCIRAVTIDTQCKLALTGGEDGTVRLWALDGEEDSPPQFTYRSFSRLRLPFRRWPHCILRGEKGIICTMSEKASLLWRNARIRNRIIGPVFSMSMVVLYLPGLYRTSGGWRQWAGLVLVAAISAFVPYMIAWYARAQRRKVVLWLMRMIGDGRVFGFTPLMILCPLFHVRVCPVCGKRIIGRLRWFHCESCGFRC